MNQKLEVLKAKYKNLLEREVRAYGRFKTGHLPYFQESKILFDMEVKIRIYEYILRDLESLEGENE